VGSSSSYLRPKPARRELGTEPLDLADLELGGAPPPLACDNRIGPSSE
jgi:hypothetical protein